MARLWRRAGGRKVRHIGNWPRDSRAGFAVPGGGVSTPENAEGWVERPGSLPLLTEVWTTGCRQPGGKEPVSVIELS